MENNILKEKVRKKVKEEIAISNIRKEFGMNKNKKIIYSILASCAMVIVCAGLIVNSKNGIKENNNIINNMSNKYAVVEDLQSAKEENVKLNIYKITDLASSNMDVKYDYYNGKLPAWVWEEILTEFKMTIGVELEEFKEKIPDSFSFNNFYTNSIKGYKDANLPDEYRLHDYVFEYQTENNGEVFIAICKDEEPLRDYIFDFKGEKSKIGDIELEISQYNNAYIVTFNYNDINYDIETKGISEDELLELLKSILIDANRTTEILENKDEEPIEDVDSNVNEPPVENISNYPEYYAGKYVDSNGNNVILLCEDNENNRKQICKILGITESKTIFKTAKYSYNYLEELQAKISKGMTNKELTFVISSALKDDTNNIVVTVISNNETDLEKVKKLDTKGGAIEIKFSENNANHELLLEKN